MSTSANTPASEDPLPQRIMLNVADLAQRSFANVSKRQNRYATLYSPIKADCETEYIGFCRKIFLALKSIPSIQRLIQLSVSIYFGITISNINVYLGYKYQSIKLAVNT